MNATVNSSQNMNPAQLPMLEIDSRAEIGRVTAGPARRKSLAKPAGRAPIRVILADDHPVVRKGLSSCLSQYEHISIVGEATDGQDVLRKAKALAPDMVLMDIDMPLLNGLSAAEILRKENPRIKVLILSMLSDSDFVLRVLQSGACGYVLKQAPTDELIKAIETIHAGEIHFSPDIARLALNQFVRGPGKGPHSGQIIARPLTVLASRPHDFSPTTPANHRVLP